MDLRRLRSFVDVAEGLSFRRAAERAGVTQSALSQRIRELEEDLGACLFVRDRRGVAALTEAGGALLAPAREALAALDAASAEVRRLGSAAGRTLRLGRVEYMNLPFLVPSLRYMAERHPAITVEPHELHSAQVVEALAERRIDLGFAFLPIGHPDLACRPLLEGRWMVALPEAHRLASREEIPAASLRGERLVLFERHLNPPLHDGLLAAISRAGGFAPEVVYRTAQARLGPEFAREGVGLFVFASYVVRELPAGVVARPLGGFENRLRLAAAWRGDGRTSAVSAYLEALAAVTDGAAARPPERRARAGRR